MKRECLTLLAVLAVCASIGACGGSRTTIEPAHSQTMGQELLDLQAAYKSGAMSERDYEKAKHRILERR